MKHQIKCYGNTCPDRHNCQLYTTEAESKKTEPDEKSGKKCEFFVNKIDESRNCGECVLMESEDISGSGWCDFHQKPVMCNDLACDDGLRKGGSNE